MHACDLGAGEILLTSMDRDGTKAGYDIELLRAVGDAVNVPVIASGGVGTLEHLYEGVADGRRVGAVLAASIFHFGQHSVREAKDYLAARGLTVRRPFDAVLTSADARSVPRRRGRAATVTARCRCRAGPSEGVLMPEPHYLANGAMGIAVGTRSTTTSSAATASSSTTKITRSTSSSTRTRTATARTSNWTSPHGGPRSNGA